MRGSQLLDQTDLESAGPMDGSSSSLALNKDGNRVREGIGVHMRTGFGRVSRARIARLTRRVAPLWTLRAKEQTPGADRLNGGGSAGHYYEGFLAERRRPVAPKIMEWFEVLA